MSDAIYVIAAVMVLSFAITWMLGRLVERIREPLVAINAIVVRCGFGLACTLMAVDAAVHGGWALIVVPFLGLLALWSFAVGAALIFAWAREGLESEAPRASGGSRRASG